MFLSDSMGAAHRLCRQTDWQEPPPPPHDKVPGKAKDVPLKLGPVQPRLTPFRAFFIG